MRLRCALYRRVESVVRRKILETFLNHYRRLPAALAGALLILITAGCAKQKDVTQMEPDAAYRYLVQRYNKGDYLSAVDGLDYFTLTYSGSSLVDSAQFLLAQAHYQLKEYLLAAEAYNELARRFPRSPLVPEAMFQAGLSYYKLSPKYSLDQEQTIKAIDALQGFIDYYPEQAGRVREAQKLIEECRAKLAHKEFASGVIYMKMKHYRAAEIYFQLVLDKYYDTEWAAQAAFKLGQALEGEGKKDEAAEAYRNFLYKYPGHKLKPQAESALGRIAAAGVK